MQHTLLVMGLALLGCTTAASAQQTPTSTTHHKKDMAQTVKTVTPPAPVDSSFQAKYSGSTATWAETPSGNYCATLDSSGQKEYVEYNSDGKWLRNRTDVTPDQLPNSAKQALTTQYPGMEIAAIQRLEYENISPFYKVDLKQGDQTKTVMVNDAGYIQE